MSLTYLWFYTIVSTSCTKKFSTRICSWKKLTQLIIGMFPPDVRLRHHDSVTTAPFLHDVSHHEELGTKAGDALYCVRWTLQMGSCAVDSVWRLGYGLEDRENRVRLRQRQEIIQFIITSRPALRPTQPSVQWVPGDISLPWSWPLTSIPSRGYPSPHISSGLCALLITSYLTF
jgi:hypothetical protein